MLKTVFYVHNLFVNKVHNESRLQVEASAVFNANNAELFLPRADFFCKFTWKMMHLCLLDAILSNISYIASVLAVVI